MQSIKNNKDNCERHSGQEWLARNPSTDTLRRNNGIKTSLSFITYHLLLSIRTICFVLWTAHTTQLLINKLIIAVPYNNWWLIILFCSIIERLRFLFRA